MGEARRAVVRTSRAVQTAGARRCETCARPLAGKRTKRYCDASCRAAAHRSRQTEKIRAIVRRLHAGLAELDQELERRA